MMKVLCTRAFDCESGATAMEYALIAAILSLAVLTGADRLGLSLKHQFADISGKVAAATVKGTGQGGNSGKVKRHYPDGDRGMAGTEVSW